MQICDLPTCNNAVYYDQYHTKVGDKRFCCKDHATEWAQANERLILAAENRLYPHKPPKWTKRL